MKRQEHWNKVYETRGADEVSWYQRRPDVSLALIAESGVGKEAGIIDVGGGASTLVDRLLDAGYRGLAVLDISGTALRLSRKRLGSRADAVEWFEADVTTFSPPHRFGLWHDRAVFHFLTSAADRRAYVATLKRVLEPGGGVIIATFALGGPAKCSGLAVVRYDAKGMSAELGPDFTLLEVRRETHVTPGKAEQPFVYFRYRWTRPRSSRSIGRLSKRAAGRISGPLRYPPRCLVVATAAARYAARGVARAIARLPSTASGGSMRRAA